MQGSNDYISAGFMTGNLWQGVSRAVVIRPFSKKEYALSAADPRPRPSTFYDGTPQPGRTPVIPLRPRRAPRRKAA